jgi:hypothetical protein
MPSGPGSGRAENHPEPKLPDDQRMAAYGINPRQRRRLGWVGTGRAAEAGFLPVRLRTADALERTWPWGPLTLGLERWRYPPTGIQDAYPSAVTRVPQHRLAGAEAGARSRKSPHGCRRAAGTPTRRHSTPGDPRRL